MFYRQRKQIPIYNSFYLDIIISDDIKRLNRLSNLSDEYYFAMAYKSSFKIKRRTEEIKSITIILNPSNKTDKITTSIMVHESIHVKNFIFEEIGYRQKSSNDEAEAYFTEWIFAEIEEFFNKSMKRYNESNLKQE